MTTEIETERLRLRNFTLDDLDDLAEIFGKPQVMKYLGLKGEPLTKTETETFLLSIIKHWKQHNFGRWAMISKEDDRLIGCSGLRSYEKDIELVYLIDEPEWGKGLATEAAIASLQFGFQNLDFKKIIAFTRPLNFASRKVMEKIGMRYRKEVNIFEILAVQYDITRARFFSADSMRSLGKINNSIPIEAQISGATFQADRSNLLKTL